MCVCVSLFVCVCVCCVCERNARIFVGMCNMCEKSREKDKELAKRATIRCSVYA